MLDGLGVNLTAAHVFDSQWQPLPILDLSVTHGLQVRLLYFTVFSPDYFSVCVHRHRRLLPTHLHTEGDFSLGYLIISIIYFILMSFIDEIPLFCLLY